MERIAVTGGLGFIGSAVIRLLSSAGYDVTNIDVGTYAADPQRLQDLDIPLLPVDVAEGELDDALATIKPDAVVHLAAETHVTRSESDPATFERTNVEGTRNVLGAARNHGVMRFVHVSTDEVYGPALDRPFVEEDKEPGEGLATSAYARSKALADDLAREAHPSLPVIVVRPTNCFGPWQHPEKAIPRWITRAIQGEPLPVWGDGLYVRDWMFVDDAASAIAVVLKEGQPGEVYNIAPQAPPIANLEIAKAIAVAAGREADSVYLTAYDRPSHDRRYHVDPARMKGLGWDVGEGLDMRLSETVGWYAANRSWWEPLIQEAEGLYDDKETRSL